MGNRLTDGLNTNRHQGADWARSNETYAVAARSPGPASLAAMAAGLLITGCMSAPSAPPAVAPATASAQAVTAPAAQSGASALSYGAVTSQVVRDRTTQADLLQLFGGPNISTTDNDGVETWVYERSVTQTDVTSGSQNWQAAAGLGVFFGHVSANAQGTGGQSTTASSVASSFRSLTVVVKFNPNKTVKDYSVRSSQF
jgi:hypothetical protein